MILDQKLSPYTCGTPSPSLAFAVNWVWRRICASDCGMSSPVGHMCRNRVSGSWSSTDAATSNLWHMPSLARVHIASTRRESAISGVPVAWPVAPGFDGYVRTLNPTTDQNYFGTVALKAPNQWTSPQGHNIWGHGTRCHE